MANHYLKATGNWSAAATWSDTDGGAAGAAAPVDGDAVFFTANGNGLTCTIDAASACSSILASGGCTATLAGTQTITVSGNVTLLATMTIPNTITFTVTGTGNFAGSTLATLGAINLNGTGHTISGAFTCTVLTRNGTATKTNTLTLTSGTTMTCTTCAMIGNSATNRLLVQSSTIGIAATITATNWTGTLNADIRDITATNAVDFSAAGLNIVTGDCGGNTGITFTASAAQTWDGTTANWSTAARWTSRVPLPQDDVSAGGAGNTITVDMPRIGKSITFTGTPTVSLSNAISIYGSYTLVSGMTYTSNNKDIDIRGRGNFTLTSAGKDLYYFSVNAPTGTLTLQDNLTMTNAIGFNYGTLTFNGKNVTCLSFAAGIDGIRTLNLGSGTLTLNSAAVAANKWQATSIMTLNAGTSTIVMTNSGANAQGFTGGAKTYHNVTVQGAGNYTLTITGSNTFHTFKVDANQAAKSVVTTGTTQTIQDLRRDGGANVVTWTGGTVTGESGRANLDYLSLTNVVAGLSLTYYAGTHSTDGGGNTNWIFNNLNNLFKDSAQHVSEMIMMGMITN